MSACAKHQWTGRVAGPCPDCKREAIEAMRQPLQWTATGGFMARVTHEGKDLALIIQPSWHVLAVQTASAASLDDVLANHAHQVVGSYDTLAEALVNAESYAAAWLKGFRSTQADPCECEEIAKPTETIDAGARARRRPTSTRTSRKQA